MSDVQVKICGIKTPELAVFCAKLGVQYIGLVFCESSLRYVDIETASLICHATRASGAIPVGVFTGADAECIMKICGQTGIDHIQLHGMASRDALTSLPSALHKIYVVTVNGQVVSPIPPAHLSCLRPEKDFILFDGMKPGSGQPIDWRVIKPSTPMRFFVAGGLNANNVGFAIQETKPFAVDISSGVESSPGEKSEALIEAWVKTVREAKYV